MQELPAGLVPGTLVHARGERWRVRHTRVGQTASIVTLDRVDAAGAGRVSTLLSPIDRIQPAVERGLVRRRRERVVRAILQAAGCERPARGLWSAAAARMDLWPWQAGPALAVLREGATRLLLADAVGLGKTVQAGLVLAELRARGLVDRALVLSPAAVRRQWVEELRDRFALPAEVLDVPALLDLTRTSPAGINPWRRLPVVISSIDLVKRPEIRSAVEHAPIDLLIVDEAHHATPGTDRHAVVSRLARQSAWVLLVSATPHSGQASDYRALLEIGADETRRPMRVIRRTASELGALVPRRTHVSLIRPSPPEMRLHHGVLAYARQMYEAPAPTPGTRLFVSLLARRAASSPRAARLTLERRLAWLTAGRDVDAPNPLLLPWEEIEGVEGDASWLSVPGLPDRQIEQRALHDLIEHARDAETAPSKLRRLARLIRRVREPVIVFSEFRDTLDACSEALAHMTTVVMLSGDLDTSERQKRLASFLDGHARVLLTTDVAGEGLNLHHASRLVVTMEWPWSPLRLEQRVGRVHRLGQRHVVHGVHLTAASSYEERVVAHVRRKAACADADLQQAESEIEERVAAIVLDLPLPPDPANHTSPSEPKVSALVSQARGEAERVTLSRTLIRACAGVATEPAWALPRRQQWSDRVVVAIEVVHQRPNGGTRGSWLVPVEVTLLAPIRDRRLWRTCAARLARDQRVHDAAAAAVAPDPAGDQWAEVRSRLDALWRTDAKPDAPPRVQPSLFDRRAIRAAEHQREAAAERDRWRAVLHARLVDAPVRVSTRAIAVLPLGHRGA